MDFSNIQVNRLKDKASPSFLSLKDMIRSWWKLRDRKIVAGKNVVVKEYVEISICNTGNLIIGDNTFFHARCWLLLTMPNPKVQIGKWVFFGRNTIIACKNNIRIGDFTIFAPNCYVIDHEHGLSQADIILNQKSVLKEVNIGRDCYFGAGTIVLGGVSIGDGAVIGAGSIVTKDIPEYQVWAGNPAKFIRLR